MSPTTMDSGLAIPPTPGLHPQGWRTTPTGHGLDDDQGVVPARPGAREQHPASPVYVGQPGPLDRAPQYAELMPEGQSLGGHLAPGSEEGECREDQGADNVQHGRRA